MLPRCSMPGPGAAYAFRELNGAQESTRTNREMCRRETGGQGSACTDGCCRQSHAVRMARPKCVATVLIRIESEGSSWAGASAITSGGFGRRSRLRSASAADGSTRNSCSRKMSRLASKSCSMCSHTTCNVFIVPSCGISPGSRRAELAGPRRWGPAGRVCSAPVSAGRQRRDGCAALRPPPSILGRSRAQSCSCAGRGPLASHLSGPAFGLTMPGRGWSDGALGKERKKILG